jgi:hypothetical protein
MSSGSLRQLRRIFDSIPTTGRFPAAQLSSPAQVRYPARKCTALRSRFPNHPRKYHIVSAGKNSLAASALHELASARYPFAGVRLLRAGARFLFACAEIVYANERTAGAEARTRSSRERLRPTNLPGLLRPWARSQCRPGYTIADDASRLPTPQSVHRSCLPFLRE